MKELGGVLGWGTGICFIAALLNYLVKRVNSKWVNKLQKDSAFRQFYQKLMKFIVRYHRWFGIGAAVIVVAHLPVQLLLNDLSSYSGITAASLLVVTAVLGMIMLFGKKRGLIGTHRVIAALTLAAFLVHVIIKK